MVADHPTLDTVFCSAIEIASAEERKAFIAQSCGNNQELQQRVEKLVNAHFRAGRFMESPAANIPSPVLEMGETAEAAAEAPGAMIGPYKLLEQIGEGGMGLVFMAEQSEPVRRKVALKILKPGMDTRQVVARFEAERQALAIMDHPNIARVIDGGATGGEPGSVNSGRPYFVMELVRGVPITEYCDQVRMAPRERLDLFLSVCQAIQHAHQKGIIHRDIKPSNVLVTEQDGKPLVKVIDFGIAKATGARLTEKALFTNFAQMIGTPLYMSPEQGGMAAGDVDTRSDIYSLGVLLYELLTGTTPFDRERMKKSAYDEIRRIIREEEPPKPSTRLSESKDSLPSISAQRQTEPTKLTKLVRGELDWIVMKALEKDRNRRYETANGFAMDVQRYLADEPVLAGPPSTRYRLKKFVRRNKGPVLAVVLVLLALLFGVVGTTWGLFRAEVRRQEAELAAEAERQAKNTAQKRLTQIERGIDLLGSIFRKLEPDAEEKEGKHLRVLLGERLDQATAELEVEAVGDTLAVAKLQRTLGSAQWALGYSDKAISLFTKARATFITQVGPDHLDTLYCMSELAVAYHSAGKLNLALPLYEETLQRQKVALGLDHPHTINSMNNLAEGYRTAGKIDFALPLWQEALRLTQTKFGSDHRETLVGMNNLAMGYEEIGNHDLALPLLKEAHQRAQATLAPNHTLLLTCLNNLAGCYRAAGNYDLALPLYDETLKRRKAKLGSEHPDTLGSMVNLASAYRETGKLPLALSLLEEALPLMKAKLGVDHPHTLTGMTSLASTYHQARKFALSLPLYEETLKLAKANLGTDHPHTLIIMSNLVEAYRAAGKLDLALPLALETVGRQKAKLGPDHRDTLTSMNNLAVVYAALGKFDLALPLWEESLRLRETKFGFDHPDTLMAMSNLAAGCNESRKLNLAQPLYEELLKRQKAKLGLDDPRTLKSMHNLAVCYRETGKLDLALPLSEETLQRRTAVLGRDHSDTMRSMNDLAWLYWHLKQLDRSIPLFEEVVPLFKRTLGEEHRDTLTNMSNLGVNYGQVGRLTEAISVLEEAYRKSRTDPELAAWIGKQLVVTYTQAGKKAEAAALLKDELASARRRLKPESLPLSDALATLGAQYLDLGAYADAEPPLRECLAIRSKLIADAWQTFAAGSLLGRALLGQKKYPEAETMLLSSYEGLKQREAQIPPHGQGYATAALERLVQLYEGLDKKAEAAKWQEILEKSKAAKPPEKSKDR